MPGEKPPPDKGRRAWPTKPSTQGRLFKEATSLFAASEKRSRYRGGEVVSFLIALKAVWLHLLPQCNFTAARLRDRMLTET